MMQGAVKLLKKQTGSFYTPALLAQQLVREVLACLPQGINFKQLKILDPAAGDGGLLLPFAHQLAILRHNQEPTASLSELLQDILSRQLYAADISQTALEKIGLPVTHLYKGDALGCENGKSVLDQWGPFDVVLANPPYIGQKGHTQLFNQLRNNPLWTHYVTPKNDLFYYFFYLALHVLKQGGVAGFITPPYFTTASGAKRLRLTLQNSVSFKRLINYEDQLLFKGAGQHTLLSVFTKGKQDGPCQVGKTSVSLAQNKLFYGTDGFIQTRAIDVRDQKLLLRMAQARLTLEQVAHVSTGLMTGCDHAFILTDAQKNALPLTKKELAKLKPFFKNSDIIPYAPNTHARLWLIDFFYPNDKGINMQDYPHLFAHLAQFKHKLLARKQNNNGIDKQLAQGKFWFGSVRRKLNFEEEKLVLPHRARNVCAAYTKGAWYASSDVYFITCPKSPYTLWTILGLLNSTPYLTWLKANGKRKGELLELYGAPLKQLPIPTLTPQKQVELEKLTRRIYSQTQTESAADTLKTQERLNTLVTSCF